MSTAAAAPAKNGTAPHPPLPPPSKTPPKFVASQLLELKLIEPDPYNPRKDFPKEAMNELISSVMLHGVREPIEVREVAGGKHRIVFGGRRYLAAKAAGHEKIPAMVRQMTDIEAAEVQLDENLKRADLSPLEVAGGYQRQLELGRTVDQVCERAGKKRSAVYAMMQLLQLGDAGRKALGEERISTSVAQLVARVPKALQDNALSMVLGTSWQGPLTFKQAETALQNHFLVDLNKAPWKLKDEGVPCVAASCSVCPKRTGNAQDLFPDAKNKDACSDPVAFRQKLFNFARAGVEKAGMKLLKPDDAPAEKLFHNAGRGHVREDSGYVDPDDRCYDDAQSRPYKQLLTGEQRQKLIHVALDTDGKQRHVLERAGLMREVKRAGLIKTRKVKKASTSSSSTRSASSSRSAEPALRRPPPPDINDLVDHALIEAMVKKVEDKGFTPQLLKVFALELAENAYVLKRRRFGEGSWEAQTKALRKKCSNAKPSELAGLFFEAAFDNVFEDFYGDQAEELPKAMGVDKKKVEAEVKKANPILWSEDSKGATGSGTRDGAEYLVEKKGKAFVFKKPAEAAKLELSFATLELAKAAAVRVETGLAVWKSEEPPAKPSLKELVSGKSKAVEAAVATHAAKKGAGK